MIHAVDLGGEGGQLEVAEGAFAKLRDLVQRAEGTGGCLSTVFFKDLP